MYDDREASSRTFSYLLRLWAEEGRSGRVWRASLTPIPGGERVGFADLEAAFRYLEQVIKRDTEQGGGGRDP